MTEGNIRLDIEDGSVAVVTMDREEKRNALTDVMSAKLLELFHDLDARDDVRAIVLTGAGEKAFTSGHDLKQALEGDSEVLFSEPNIKEFVVPGEISKPVISAVNGAAYAGGFCLAIASDLRIASPNASFASPGIKLGIVPIGGQLSMLPHLLPPAIAAEVLMLGAPLDAERAARHGFVSEIVEQGQLVDRACAMGRVISSMPPASMASVKRVIRTTLTQNVPAADAMEFWRGMVAGIGPDVQEGLSAFVERRSPDFSAPAR